LTLSSCDINARGLLNLEEKEMEREFQAGNFIDFEEFFEGFDANHIQNFYYYTSTSDRSIVPGPTLFTIIGYFEIIEEFWDYYIEGYSWMNHPPSMDPDIPGLDYSFNWMENLLWDRKHIPQGVYGGFWVCKENRMVYFSLGR